MFHLIYVSTAAQEMSSDELFALLKQSRSRNQQLNITGMLLYSKGTFFQVLEGDKKDVKEVFNSILKDKRNHGHTVLLKQEITQRSFPDWSMGFRNLSKQELSSIEGYSNFLYLSNKQLAENPNIVFDLLRQFKELA